MSLCPSFCGATSSYFSANRGALPRRQGKASPAAAAAAGVKATFCTSTEADAANPPAYRCATLEKSMCRVCVACACFTRLTRVALNARTQNAELWEQFRKSPAGSTLPDPNPSVPRTSLCGFASVQNLCSSWVHGRVPWQRQSNVAGPCRGTAGSSQRLTGPSIWCQQGTPLLQSRARMPPLSSPLPTSGHWGASADGGAPPAPSNCV